MRFAFTVEPGEVNLSFLQLHSESECSNPAFMGFQLLRKSHVVVFIASSYKHAVWLVSALVKIESVFALFGIAHLYGTFRARFRVFRYFGDNFVTRVWHPFSIHLCTLLAFTGLVSLISVSETPSRRGVLTAAVNESPVRQLHRRGCKGLF